MNQRGGIFIGILVFLIAIGGAALYIAVIEPINVNVNLAAGPVIGKNEVYDNGSPSAAIFFGAPILIFFVGAYFLWKNSGN